MESNGNGRNGHTGIALPADRLPPQNIEAEEGVLGAIIMDNAVLDEIVPILNTGHFYRDSHQIIYRTIGELYAEQIPVDSILLEERLRRNDQLDRIGGLDAILRLLGSVPHSANARYYAQVVREKAVSRDLIEQSNRISERSYSNSFTAEDLVALASADISGIAESQASDDKVFTSEQTADAYLKVLSKRASGKGSGRKTGIGQLDNLIVGMDGGNLIIIGAPSSVGKTALAVQIARYNAIDQVVNGGEIVQESDTVLYCTLEMTHAELFERSVCTISGIDSLTLRSGRMTPDHEHWIALDDAVRTMRGAKLRTFDAGLMTMESVRACASKIKRKEGLCLVVIDHLHLMATSSGRSETRNDALAKITAGCKSMARELDCAVILLSQCSRKPGQREDHKPQMGDLRDSGAIEQDADVVIMPYRPGYWDREASVDMTRVELHVLKQRNGPTGVVEIACDMSRGTFGDKTMYIDNRTRPEENPDFDKTTDFRDHREPREMF